MKNKPQIEDLLKELEELMTDRISELYQHRDHITNAMQARHNYIYYRRIIWEIRDKMK